MQKIGIGGGLGDMGQGMKFYNLFLIQGFLLARKLAGSCSLPALKIQFVEYSQFIQGVLTGPISCL